MSNSKEALATEASDGEALSSSGSASDGDLQRALSNPARLAPADGVRENPDPSAKSSRPSAPVRAHRKAAVKEAVIALFGDGGVPNGIMEEKRAKLINDWLVAHDRQRVSKATIRRALRELR